MDPQEDVELVRLKEMSYLEEPGPTLRVSQRGKGVANTLARFACVIGKVGPTSTLWLKSGSASFRAVVYLT
ncbi:hypothetical protein Csa_014339 [Cucumis sativus]|uniref:Uncharacterized protein n=1 Tax=Cucumis sativus TaxID=3659 RepID=A0A0A0LRW8_CUCSA|nr:hypothetical protein Csa_014339 [Cucumis sativus]